MSEINWGVSFIVAFVLMAQAAVIGIASYRYGYSAGHKDAQPKTTASTSGYVRVIDKSGNSVVAPAPMTYVNPGVTPITDRHEIDAENGWAN